MIAPPQTRRFSVDDYHRMGDAGILTEDDRVELLGGEVVEMSPIGSRHARVVNRLTRLLVAAVGDRAIVSVQNPIVLPPLSEPQPDVALLAWRDDFYPDLPRPAEVLLVIEVADSSLLFDRTRKLPLYAGAGIGESWLVDVVAGVIEVHTEPGAAGYGRRRLLGPGESLAPAALPDLVFDAASILG